MGGSLDQVAAQVLTSAAGRRQTAGIPIIWPPDPDWDIPVDPPHPWLAGHWVPVDGGLGQWAGMGLVAESI